MVEHRRSGIPDSGYSMSPDVLAFREGLYDLADVITADDIARSNFSRHLDARIDRRTDYYHFIEEELLRKRIVSPLPQTPVNPYAFSHELQQVMPPQLFANLLRKLQSRKEGKPIVKKFTDFANKMTDRTTTYAIDEAANLAAKSNARIFGHYMMDFGLAAIYGPDYPNVVPAEAKVASDGTPARRYLAVLEASKDFTTPATDATEVVERLRQLFPANPTATDKSAWNALRETQAFIGIRQNCTAPGLTRIIFEAYGRKLNEVPYQQKLIRALNSPPTR